ncbi:MAG TPA: caspase family protein [Allocoleopsis sp.]
MANYACMAIGINRYQFLQPLSYGQADAHALWQFLLNQANLPASQCLLLTDTSPPVDEVATYPTQETIWRWIESSQPHRSNGTNGVPATWRWFFFSGYGVSWDGIDYLMPIDGNPYDIPRTGIPVRALFEALQAQGNENILALLDINRSPGFQSGTAVGAETVQLAQDMGITVVLSSQLNEFSHEAAALGNGLFTAALLEALRYYHTDITLEELEYYLCDRLPELSQHHWRPIQIPLIVTPSEAVRPQLILPTAVNARLNAQTVAQMPSTLPNVEEELGNHSLNGTVAGQRGTAVSLENRPSSHASSTDAVAPNPPASSGAMVHAQQQARPNAKETPWWQPLLLWGGAILLLVLMVVAVVLRHRDVFMQHSGVETPTSDKTVVNPSANGSPNPETRQLPASPPSRLQVNQATLERAKRLLRPNQASLFNKAIVEARAIKPNDPLYQQARQNLTRWSKVILDVAQGRASQGNFAGAIAAAQLVPKDDLSVYTDAQQAITKWQGFAQKQQHNQQLIAAAKQQIQPNQASSYIRAIATVRNINPGEPGRAQSEQLIDQWSRQIYLLANSRAAEGQYPQAVQTAALVPTRTSSYNAAQNAIAKWKQGKPPQQSQPTALLISTAKKQIQPNQASSYNRAIATLQKIAPGQPGYTEAQQLITQWSRQIYLMANSWASEGKFSQAVQTATLVPSGTPSYETAQTAIAKWKQGQR